jgi:hypothetical protein
MLKFENYLTPVKMNFLVPIKIGLKGAILFIFASILDKLKNLGSGN